MSKIGEHININTDLTQVVGDKNYELSNLPTTFGIGNVLQVVTDRKLAQDNGVYDPETGLYSSDTEDGIVDYFTADVVSQSDYYPFGMMLPGRNSSDDSYRYGFNGMEMDIPKLLLIGLLMGKNLVIRGGFLQNILKK